MPPNPIRDRRISRNISLHDLAESCGMSRAQLVAVEEGRRSLTLNQAIDLAQALGIDAAEMRHYVG